MKTENITGIRARGRNDSFDLRSTDVWGAGDGNVGIDFNSKRLYKNPPIWLFGPQDKIVALLETLLAQVKEIT